MLPVIYSASSTEFSSNGQGVLVDCLSCSVTEERNGIFEMELTYPEHGQHADKLVVDAIIKATAHKGDEGQLFRIYSIEKNLAGEIVCHCQHISYQLSFIPCAPCTASSVSEAFIKIRANMQTQDDGFSFWTDKSTAANFKIEVPVSTKSILGGMVGSILDVYGGEYEFNNKSVKLWNNRGRDNNVVLRYGKNITDIKQDCNIADTYTGLRPYYKDEDTFIELPSADKCVWCDNAQSFPYKRVLVYDATSEFEELTDSYGDKVPPTQSDLVAFAQKYIRTHEFGVPKVSVDVDFEALWDTPEYAEIANLESVNLCDTVHVLFDAYDISVKSKVNRTVYDSLLERYTSISVGSVNANFTDAVASIPEKTSELMSGSTTRLQLAQQRATATLLGRNGGFKVEKTNGDGQIIETLFMDSLNEGTATKVWRWNINGLGYSPNGPGGPYTVAITKDGEIVADFITTGTLDADEVDIVNLKAQNVLINSSTTVAGKFGTIDNTLTTYNTRISNNTNSITLEAQARTALEGRMDTAESNITKANNGFTIIWDSNFGQTYSGGEALICKYDQQTGQISSGSAGWVVWKGVVRTIPRTEYNPNTMVPYNIPVYLVLRLSSASATIGTVYPVWYDSGWKHLNKGADATTSDQAVAAWTWVEDTDIVIGSCVEPKSEGVFTDCRIYDPPWSCKFITTSTVTAASVSAELVIANNNISSKVSQTDYNGQTIASLINQSASTVTISANHINLNGAVTANNNVKIGTDGKITAVNADISGKITASSGDIAGWKIGSTTFSKTTTIDGAEYHVYIQAPSSPTSGSAAFAVKKTVDGTNTWPFIVHYDGSMSATDATINGRITAIGGKIGKFLINENTTNSYLYTGSGSTMAGMGASGQAFWAGSSTSNSAPFRVAYDGTFVATKAEITGDITATGGKIGKFNITDTYLDTGTGSNNAGMGGNQAFWAGNTSSNNAPFRVAYDGTLVATSATITGNITATSGTIGGCTISNGVLTVKNANIESINGSKVGSGINGSNISSGTVAEGRIDGALLRTSQLGDKIASLSVLNVTSVTQNSHSGRFTINGLFTLLNADSTYTERHPMWFKMKSASEYASWTALRTDLADKYLLIGTASV